MLQQKRILVIDDEVNVANLLRMNLEAETIRL
jgi:DNA-binding NtrC family response regulator